ncbi:MAG: 2-phospho-L-lactate transferase [Steroidobacteraceae bacterium]|nr:2-phospho-L-lactate transferase [Steroidobacteraceae bacterium]
MLALSGGIGGAKLALGLQAVLPRGALAVLANTGDDFEHLGLLICPDIDTLLYTLSGRADPQRGWGRADETWHCLDALRELGGEDWFALGDRDLALHIVRTQRLRRGERLTEVTAALADRFGLATRILPMADDPVRTWLRTDAGELEFQRYFVALRAAPAVRAIEYRGATTARANPIALDLLRSAELDAVVICPSNPWLSIAPLLALPELRAALLATAAPVVGVSPIVGGRALKGPTAKIMSELGYEVSARAVAEFYGELLDGFVLDTVDAALAARLPLPTFIGATVMQNLDDKRRLAADVLRFAAQLR